jgi:hypothetical protein
VRNHAKGLSRAKTTQKAIVCRAAPNYLSISATRVRLHTQIKAAILVISKRDDDQTEQSLQSAEDALSVIENYLKQWTPPRILESFCPVGQVGKHEFARRRCASSHVQ